MYRAVPADKPDQVKAFVKNVLADIIPKKLFGSTANKLKIFDCECSDKELVYL